MTDLYRLQYKLHYMVTQNNGQSQTLWNM